MFAKSQLILRRLNTSVLFYSLLPLNPHHQLPPQKQKKSAFLTQKG